MNTHDPANPTTPIESHRTLRTMLFDAHTTSPDRIAHDAALVYHLAEVLNTLPTKCLTAYWPTQGKFDMLTILDHWLVADATRHALLPIMTDKFSPLQFQQWMPDCGMASGAYDIPIPHSGEMETLDALLTPYVGFDAQHYWVGYGGDFCDRMPAALHIAGHRPRVTGVVYEVNRAESIAPQSRGIVMGCIVTEHGVF